MSAKKIAYLILIIFIIIVIVTPLLLLKALLPSSTTYKYFSKVIVIDTYSNNLEERTLNAVFLKTFKKDDGVYMKVVYRDDRNKLRIIDVFLAGRYKNQNFKTTPLIMNDENVLDVDSSDARYPIKFGKRVQIEYLHSADGFDEGSKVEICGISEKTEVFCKKTEYLVNNIQGDMKSFDEIGVPKADVLIAIGVKVD